MTWVRVSRVLVGAALLSTLLLAACGSAVSQPEEALTLNNLFQGYSLAYPAGYDVVLYQENGVALVVDSLLNVEDARLDITVEPAQGRSAEQSAADFAAEYPGFELAQSTIRLGGEPAVVLESVPGQELTRVVLAVHADQLFTLRFIPADPDQEEAFAMMEDLYDRVTESFAFDPAP